MVSFRRRMAGGTGSVPSVPRCAGIAARAITSDVPRGRKALRDERAIAL